MDARLPVLNSRMMGVHDAWYLGKHLLARIDGTCDRQGCRARFAGFALFVGFADREPEGSDVVIFGLVVLLLVVAS
jgi:hypothetical protein